MLNKLFYLGKLETVVCRTANDRCIAAGQSDIHRRSRRRRAMRKHYEIMRREGVRPLSVVRSRSRCRRSGNWFGVRPYRSGPIVALPSRGGAALPGGPRSVHHGCVRETGVAFPHEPPVPSADSPPPAVPPGPPLRPAFAARVEVVCRVGGALPRGWWCFAGRVAVLCRAGAALPRE